MAFTRSGFIILFAAFSILFLSCNVASRETKPTDADEQIEVIKDVKNNKLVQDLGKFAVEEANKKISYSESMTFDEVVEAKRLVRRNGDTYFIISKLKKQKKEFKFMGYVVEKPGERFLKAWVLEEGHT